ncbi:MAG: nuclear transport factor 2 family protein [Pseudomonadota bacterium]
MTNTEIVHAWNEAFFAGDMDTVAQYMSDRFEFIGPAPEPLSKEAYLGMMLTLKNAFPDLTNNLQILSEEGNSVTGSVEMIGTHSALLDLTNMIGKTVEATDIKWHNPVETFTITFEKGQMTSFTVDVPEDGGFTGLLTQLGIQM